MSKIPLSFTSTRNRFYIVLQITVALLFIGFFFFKASISKNEISEFGAIVKSKPKITSNTSGHKSIEFKISDCKYEMKIENAALEALGDRKEFLNNISIGDSIYLSISIWDYQNVILLKKETRPLTGTRIHVYSLRSDHKNYVNIVQYNHYKKKDEFLGAIFGVALLILVAITIIKKVPLSTFLERNWWILLAMLPLVLIYSWYLFKI